MLGSESKKSDTLTSKGGSVSIGSNNPFDDPLIDPGYYTSEFDLLAAREGIKKAMKFTKAPVWEDIITGFVGPWANATTDAEIDDTIRNNTESGLHPVGTAAMSPKNASWGVVDPDLLVKKVSGLRIVDASVMVSTLAEAIYSETDSEKLAAIYTLCSYASSCVYYCGTGSRYDQEHLAVIHATIGAIIKLANNTGGRPR